MSETGFSHRLTAYKIVGHFFVLSYLNISGHNQVENSFFRISNISVPCPHAQLFSAQCRFSLSVFSFKKQCKVKNHIKSVTFALHVFRYFSGNHHPIVMKFHKHHFLVFRQLPGKLQQRLLCSLKVRPFDMQ